MASRSRRSSASAGVALEGGLRRGSLAEARRAEREQGGPAHEERVGPIREASGMMIRLLRSMRPEGCRPFGGERAFEDASAG